MKSKSKQLTEKSTSAMVAAIEIYNKPDFKYRSEAFSILVINSWELLFKSKRLSDNGNDIKKLYIYEAKKKKDGSDSKVKTPKLTRSNSPFTHSLDYLAKDLVQIQALDPIVWNNIQALMEIRDSSIHFYNSCSEKLNIKIQEIGTASIKNYVHLIKDWFDVDLSAYNFFLMPIAFVGLHHDFEGVILSPEEEGLFSYLTDLSKDENDNSPYSVAINIELKFTKSKSEQAITVKQVSPHESEATKIILSEESMRERFPWDYKTFITNLKNRYSDFKQDRKFNLIYNSIKANNKLCRIKSLDEESKKSPTKPWFSPNVFQEFDKHYTKNNARSLV